MIKKIKHLPMLKKIMNSMIHMENNPIKAMRIPQNSSGRNKYLHIYKVSSMSCKIQCIIIKWLIKIIMKYPSLNKIKQLRVKIRNNLRNRLEWINTRRFLWRKTWVWARFTRHSINPWLQRRRINSSRKLKSNKETAQWLLLSLKDYLWFQRNLILNKEKLGMELIQIHLPHVHLKCLLELQLHSQNLIKVNKTSRFLGTIPTTLQALRSS